VQVCPALQGTHAAPAVATAPHWVVVSVAVGTQTPAEQHPWQVVALQGGVTQAPALHTWPSPQATHASPPTPQMVAFWLAEAMQLLPGVQQPEQLLVSQVPPVHWPLVQLCPRLHCMQEAPGAAVAPHWPSVWFPGAMHSPAALQQPLQLAALQTAGVTHCALELQA
jgi:hypothetical protein